MTERTEEERRDGIATSFSSMKCDCCRKYSKDEAREAIDIAMVIHQDVFDYIAKKAKVSRSPELAMFFAFKELEANMPQYVEVTGQFAFDKGRVAH